MGLITPRGSVKGATKILKPMNLTLTHKICKAATFWADQSVFAFCVRCDKERLFANGGDISIRANCTLLLICVCECVCNANAKSAAAAESARGEATRAARAPKPGLVPFIPEFALEAPAAHAATPSCVLPGAQLTLGLDRRREREKELPPLGRAHRQGWRRRGSWRDAMPDSIIVFLLRFDLNSPKAKGRMITQTHWKYLCAYTQIAICMVEDHWVALCNAIFCYAARN